MKPILTVVALGLGFSGLVAAQNLQRSVEFKITYAATTGDDPIFANPLAVPGSTGRFDLSLTTRPDPYEVPPYTSLYWVPGVWHVTETGGGGFGLANDGVHVASLTDDHPAWDALAFSADTSMGGAQSSGETVLHCSAV